MRTEFLQQVERFRQAARDADGFATAAQQIYAGVARELGECVQLLEAAQRAVEQERATRITAERHKDRFRYALWVYLQERDGIAGIHAPTPETLKLIRELVTDLE